MAVYVGRRIRAPVTSGLQAAGSEELHQLRPWGGRIAFLLGHRDANVTRAVYVRELSDVRRRAMRRSRMIAEFSDLLDT
jgi:integrase